jgi:hypothetical protein
MRAFGATGFPALDELTPVRGLARAGFGFFTFLIAVTLNQ